MKLPRGSLWVLALGACLLWAAIVLRPVDELDNMAEGGLARQAAPEHTTITDAPEAVAPAGNATKPPAKPELPSPRPPTTPVAAKVSEDANSQGEEEPPQTFPRPERNGPVDEYKALYARESRDSTALSAERDIEAAFRTKHIPPGLLESVVCRSSVCRVRTRWSPDHAEGFMMALTALLIVDPTGETAPRFDSILAIDPESDPSDRSQQVAVYFKRNE